MPVHRGCMFVYTGGRVNFAIRKNLLLLLKGFKTYHPKYATLADRLFQAKDNQDPAT